MNKVILFFFLLFSTSLLAKQVLDDKFEILTPIDKGIYYESIASVSVKIPKKTKVTKIIIKSFSKNYTIDVNLDRKVYCKSIDLQLGKNDIEVIFYDNEKAIKAKKHSIIYKEEIFPNFNEVIQNYNKNYFHNNKNEQICQSCHDLNNEIDLVKNNSKDKLNSVLEDTRESKCFDCHKKLNDRKNSHAPSVNLICTECHNGNTGDYNINKKNKSRFLQPDPISGQCFNCHENVENEWLEREYTHGPAMNGRCTTCHNPHGSDEIFFTKKPIWDLCTTCHSEKAVGNHVVSSFVFSRNKGSHPTKGPKDPAREDRELVCSSCHNPHGSNGIHLLRMEGKKPFGICARCHDKL